MKKFSRSLVLALLTVLSFSVACDIRDFAPIPTVGFVQPINDAMVTTPVFIELEAKHWVIEPPGVRRDGAGYFVVILEGGCIEEGRLFDFDDIFVHLQDGSSSTWVDVGPGVYEVCLQIADGNQRATRLTEMITFEVVD